MISFVSNEKNRRGEIQDKNPAIIPSVSQVLYLENVCWQYIFFIAHFDRERIPERVVHAKGAGAHGVFGKDSLLIEKDVII